MLTIGTAAYQNAASLQTSDSRLLRQTASATTGLTQPAALGVTTTAPAGDRVSLSPAVEVARLRASLGLAPTGKLTRQDFETQIQSDHEAVRQTIQAKLDQGSGAGNTMGQITVTQDAKGQMQVAGDWPGKEALAKDLNADPEFTAMFARLAANSKVLSYAGQSMNGGQGATLNDYLDNETADSNLSTLLQQYDTLKGSTNSLASLINLSSNQGEPFALTYTNNATPRS
jgi:hypothetical protein